MIKTYKNKRFERLHKGEKVRIAPGIDRALAIKRLNLLDTISDIDDIPNINRFRPHQLKGNRKGQWAININGPWRLVFDWIEGHAYNVEIIDYHK